MARRQERDNTVNNTREGRKEAKMITYKEYKKIDAELVRMHSETDDPELKNMLSEMLNISWDIGWTLLRKEKTR